MSAPSLAELLSREHRRLDDLFGRFFAAAASGDPEFAREAIATFDEALRRHMRFEEERLMPQPGTGRLTPGKGETDEQRLFRELRLEHVQIRELSAMIRRCLDEKDELPGARGLAPNLARRWDAHTAREEAEAGRLEQRLGPDAAAVILQELDSSR